MSGGHDRRWPLSKTQEFLWFLGGRWPESGMVERFTVSLTEQLPDGTDPDHVRQALTALIARHEVLRSAIDVADDGPAVVIADPSEARLRIHDLGPGAPEQQIDDTLADCLGHPVPATTAPAARFDLVLSGSRRYLQVSVHHLFFDHWSAALLRRELSELLDRLRQGEELPPPQETPQYVDFAHWEREMLQRRSARSGITYWTQRLADLPRLEVPTDRPRPWHRSSSAGKAMVMIPPQDYRRLRQLADELRATPFMVLSTFFLALLARLTGQLDVAIPIVFAGHRPGPAADLLGYFDNLLFLRTRLADDRSVRDTVRSARSEHLEAYEHHDTPILDVIAQQPRLLLLLGDPRNVWVLFHLQVDPASLSRSLAGEAAAEDGPEAASPSGQLDTEESSLASGYNFGADLDVMLREVDGGLLMTVLYATDLFDAATVDGWLLDFGRGVAAAVRDPSLPLLGVFAASATTAPTSGG